MDLRRLPVVLAAACSTHHGPAAITPTIAPATTALIAASATTYQAVTEEAPWSLTASDGSGLVLARVDARSVVEGPLAFTELHLYFHNPEHRVREGTFAITLPPGAAVSRFAMENNGAFMEAEVVEKMIARRAYEDFLHRRQDPALLEKGAGNQFTARVFPIPADADKHLVIGYSQELRDARYVLPLKGLPTVDRIDAKVDVANAAGGFDEQTLAQRAWQPDRDFQVVANGATAVAAGNLVAARVQVGLKSADDAPSAVTILVDTSGSRALGFAREAKQVRELVRGLAAKYGHLPLDIVAFDQETALIYRGHADGVGADLEQQILGRGAFGASDLGQALTWLATTGAKSRVVIVGDAVVTAGPERDALVAAAKGLRVDRIDVALTGGIRDEELAASLARGAAAKPGAVIDLDARADEAVRRIGLAVSTGARIEVANAREVYPSAIAAAQAGDSVTVYARLAKPSREISIAVAGIARTVATTSVPPALVERSVAAAEIVALEARLAVAAPAEAASLKTSIAKRSVAARVVSSETAMLVLETEADYARYGIDRKALADILVVGPHGVQLEHRTALVIAAPAKPEIREELQNKADTPAAKRKRGETEEMEKRLEPAKELDARDGDPVVVPKPPVLEPEPAAAPPPPPTPPPPASGQLRMAGEHRIRPPDVPAPPAMQVRASRDTGTNIAQAQISQDEQWPPPSSSPALTGPLAEITAAIKSGRIVDAQRQALAWHGREPGDVLALIGVGEAFEASHDDGFAARVYGSIIDLYPARADFRRFAGERLERIEARHRDSGALAVDTYRRAVAERPDHLTGHRLLAYALVRRGDHAGAFAAIIRGLEQKYPEGRFRGGLRVLAEDAGLIGAAYVAHAPAKAAEVAAALAKHGAHFATEPSTRFVLYWETDGNDVDFHIQDAKRGHAFFSKKHLASGGDLYEDVTTGYGPECFTIPGTPSAGPYRLSINYYSQGPMGYGMGLLEILRHDGKGGLAFEERPYVIMNDHAYVDLGDAR